MNKRLITKRQERALRLCHQGFLGLSQTEAAKRMNITQSALSDLLAKVKKVLPDYFPILTKTEAERYHLYCVEGHSVDDIAERFRVTPDSVYKALQRAKDKGMCFTEPKGRVLSYSPDMDANIKHRF